MTSRASRFVFASLLAVAAALPLAAHAQGVFRSVMPDGRVIYGDAPAPGAKEAKAVNLPPPNISTPAPPAPTSGPSAEQVSASADASVAGAQQQLDKAKAALEAGREPREGERIGTKSGASRLTEAYFQRIQGLEAAVVAAQKRLDNALARRTSVR